jgi:ComF family protein
LCARCLATVTQAPVREVPGLDDIRVRANFEGAISAAIHAFKYKRQTRLVQPLGALLCETLQDVDWPVDVVLAVPLHAARLRERGYNQAALLADYLARAQGWACQPAAIRRVRETASQVHLNAQERRMNVADAFAADPECVRGQCVLIIDDVLTTGATLSACADAVRVAGATRVFGATVAGAVYSKDPASGVSDTSV